MDSESERTSDNMSRGACYRLETFEAFEDAEKLV